MSDDTPTLDHYIGGTTTPGSGERTGPVYDPAKGEVSKHVRFAAPADVDAAVGAARKAFVDWAETSIAKRQTIMFAFREKLNARKDELAAILTSEHGKVLGDAAGEVARGLEVGDQLFEERVEVVAAAGLRDVRTEFDDGAGDGGGGRGRNQGVGHVGLLGDRCHHPAARYMPACVMYLR